MGGAPALSLAQQPSPSPSLQQAGPRELVCQVRYGSETRELRLSPSADPYAAGTVDFEARFRLRAVVMGSAAQIEHVTLSAYELAENSPPVILHQLRLQGPFAQQQGVADLTGWQHVYAAGLGREMRYGCALLPVGTAGPMQAHIADETMLSAPAAQQAVRIAWMGDVMLADGPGRFMARKGDPFKPFASRMAKADIRVANLECVIASGGKALAKPWTFRASPRVLPVLTRHVDVVSVANNHSGDFGKSAFAEMLTRLNKAGLPYFGGGMDWREAHRPFIIERKGVKIALLGYDEFFPRVFEAGEHLPGVAWSEDEQVAYDIRQARMQADVVIPFMHWGQEHEPRANERQRELARLMIDAGADAVVGAHPHVVQDTETYKGKPIVYSLGNFVFDGFSSIENNTGWVLWMEVTKQGVTAWHVEQARIDSQGTPHPVE